MALLNSIANRLNVPFPIVLVIGGLLLALIPGIPNVEFDPDLVLVVFLPPLLYSAAFFADQQAMRRCWRSGWCWRRCRSSAATRPSFRTQTLWEFLTFILNATLFVLIGLQLPVIVDGLGHTSLSTGHAIGYALVAAPAVVAIRFIRGFGSTALLCAIDLRPSQKAKRSTWRERIINGWSRMRDAVSLAAALALPLTTDSGSPFPRRDLILFVTFSVILFTLVVQGGTFPWLIPALRVREDGEEERREELHGQPAIAKATLERIDELSEAEWTHDETIECVRALYEFRRRRGTARQWSRLERRDPAAGAGARSRGVEVGGLMRIQVLERRQRIERPLDQVFPFYADAANLERITPPWLGFEVTTPKPIEMRTGALIDYRLRLHGIPVRWRTRIEEWRPPLRFVDAQLSGPYSLWHHTHTFEADGENVTILGDRVRYAIPFGPAGELARALFVGRDLERIFDYRHDAVAELLDGSGAPSAPSP